MATNFGFSALVALCLLQSCPGANVHAGSAQAGDEVYLLQAQVEMKRSTATDAKHAVEAETDSDSADQSYPSLTTCGSSDTPKASEPAVVAQAAAPSIQKEFPMQAEAEVGSPSTSVLGNVLQMLALLLVADVLRRYGSKEKAAGTAPGTAPKERSVKSPAPANSSPALLAAALAADEADFEKAVAGASATQLQQVDKWGCTALHYAAKGGSASIVSRLVSFGVRIEAIDAWDETPLHLAARAGHADACKVLLAAGACVDATNAEEYTPLVVAGQANQAAVCSLLIEHGAGVAGLDSEEVPSLVAELLAQESSE